MVDDFDKFAHAVQREIFTHGNRSSVFKVLILGVEDAAMIGFCFHIQKLQTDNEDLLSRGAWNRKIHMDMLLK